MLVVDEVRLVLVPLVVPRRVVVDEPSVFTVLVVVRAEPFVLTREVVVVEAGDTLRVEVLALPEVVEVLEVEVEEVELLELLELLVVLLLLVDVELVVPVEPLTRLEVPELVEVLELPAAALVSLVRLVDVRPVVVVVVVLDATRCCSSRALEIAAVRLEPPLSALAIRLSKDCSG